MMTNILTHLIRAALLTALTPIFSARGQEPSAAIVPATAAARAKSDTEAEKKAAAWSTSLALGDAAKEARVAAVVAAHLKTTRPPRSRPASTPPPASRSACSTGKSSPTPRCRSPSTPH